MIKLSKILVVFVSVCAIWSSCNLDETVNSKVAVIPKVQQLATVQSGKCGALDFISADENISEQTVALFSETLKLESRVTGTKGVQLLNSSDYKKEAYSLDITKDGIVISASDKSGFFYALQTLNQLKEFHGGIENIPLRVGEFPKGVREFPKRG